MLQSSNLVRKFVSIRVPHELMCYCSPQFQMLQEPWYNCVTKAFGGKDTDAAEYKSLAESCLPNFLALLEQSL